MGRKLEQTASPQRNFTLTTAERVQAIVMGLPAWARRLKHIEDLTAQIAEAHRAGELSLAKKQLAELVTLIDTHNAYYPVEANLPLDPETSRLMAGGEPWRPMPHPTLESIVAASSVEALPPSLVWSDTPDALQVELETDGDSVTLRLDDDALSCATDAGVFASVPTSEIEEFVAGPCVRIVTVHTEIVDLPFRLAASTIESIVAELGARLRVLRAAKSDYRGVPVED